MTDAADSNPKPADANTPFLMTVGIRVGKQVDKRDAFFNTRHISGSSLLTSLCVGFVFFGVALALDAAAEPIREKVLTSGPVGKTRLTGTEITRLFSDVLDRGEVQSQPGISAETHWPADGTFVSRWWTEGNSASDASGKGAVKQKVTGRWRTEHGLRCVAFDSGTKPDWSCAEVWLLDNGRVLSLNPDGSAQGLHRLSPLK